jgi:hypothetical protein
MRQVAAGYNIENLSTSHDGDQTFQTQIKSGALEMSLTI